MLAKTDPNAFAADDLFDHVRNVQMAAVMADMALAMFVTPPLAAGGQFMRLEAPTGF